jgi:hypothetical protein
MKVALNPAELRLIRSMTNTNFSCKAGEGRVELALRNWACSRRSVEP